MAKTTDVLVIDPQGITMTVDILDLNAVSITAYTAASGASTHTLPLAITTATSFYLTAPGEYTVSAKVNGSEIAGPAGATAKVSARHGNPVTVTPRLNTSEVASLFGTLYGLCKLAGTSASGSTPGTCVKKIEVFSAAGVSLGFVPVYDAIT